MRVTLGHADGLSRFEEYTLRTIAAGQNTVDAIADILGVARSVVLDTCVDLLRVGYILLRHNGAAMEVVQAVRDEMGDPLEPRHDWARRLAPAAPPAPLEYDLLQDLVSGSVFPPIHGLTDARDWILCPEDVTLEDVTTVPKSILLEATAGRMRRIVDKRGARETGPLSRRGTRVTDVAIVGLGTEGTRVFTSPATVVAEVARRRSFDSDVRPNLIVVGPPELHGGVRRRIAAKLMQMWDAGIARGPGQFFGRLEERLLSAETLVDDSGADRIIDPARSIEELEEAIEQIPAAIETGNDAVASLHDQLFELERNATVCIESATSMQAEPSLVVGAAQHHALLLAALKEAHHQVVMTSPWLGQLETNKALREALTDAVARNIRVHLAWGVDRAADFDKELGPATRELIDLLLPQAQRTGGLFIAQRAAGVHAKLFTCDMSWAVVSTFNVLNSSSERRELELGVRIDGPGAQAAEAESDPVLAGVRNPVDQRRPVAASVCEVLRWVRGITPDYQLRPLIIDDPALEGRRALAPSIEVGEAVEAPGDFGIWKGTFERRAEVLRNRARSLGSAVYLVANGQHRDVLIAALQHARMRIIVSSKDLGAGLLGEAVSELLMQATRRGVGVSVYHAGYAEWSDELQRRKEQLIDAGVVFDLRDVHAKLLVCDDWVVVTSYNFLSSVGYYDQERRARHELGVRVVSKPIADRVALELQRAPSR
ncbi:MAG TPA: phospholipase D-like domain-containing protein [Polyangia bacterium]|nr:phospholipase D-like domain-containing protein [Polyangia bacterium]